MDIIYFEYIIFDPPVPTTGEIYIWARTSNNNLSIIYDSGANNTGGTEQLWSVKI